VSQPPEEQIASPSAIAAEKAALRTQIRAVRQELDLETCLVAANNLAAALLDLPELAAARTVLAYHAMPEEIDPEPTLRGLRDAGATIVYPRIEAPGVVELHVVDRDSALLPGPFGLAEPPAAAPRVDPSAIDVAIVPGVAFDVSGRRLGYGGGYFDRLIPRFRPDCVIIGAAFDLQVIDAVPVDSLDARVHLVVTPTRVIRAEP
jgi:5-formyltetrahydrofolate cyclo-ligase